MSSLEKVTVRFTHTDQVLTINNVVDILYSEDPPTICFYQLNGDQVEVFSKKVIAIVYTPIEPSHEDSSDVEAPQQFGDINVPSLPDKLHKEQSQEHQES